MVSQMRRLEERASGTVLAERVALGLTRLATATSRTVETWLTVIGVGAGTGVFDAIDGVVPTMTTMP